MRLDKFLAHTGFGSRKDVKVIVKAGSVTIDGEPELRPERHVNPDVNVVRVDGEVIDYVKYIYVIMNKPAGVVSAVSDPYGEITVSQLAYEICGIDGLYPVGRLDKDATGLIILTNDGIFTHRVTSPKKNVEKTYLVEVAGELSERDVTAFKNRVALEDGYLCREARMEVIGNTPHPSGITVGRALVTITEGKFHQVKRMFIAIGKQVISLKRVSFCGIPLPDDLPEGTARPLNESELSSIAPYLADE